MLAQPLRYWRGWKLSTKRTFYVLLALFLAAVLMQVIVSIGLQPGVYAYTLKPDIHSFTHTADSLQTPLGNILLREDAALVLQYAKGELRTLQPVVYYGMYGVLMLFLVFALAVAVKLQRIFFYAAMGGVFFFFAMLKLDLPALTGGGGPWVFLLSAAWFVAPAYYFFAFAPHHTLRVRLLVFGLSALVYSGVLMLLGGGGLVLLHIVAYSTLWICLATVVFAFIVGFDLVHLILVLTTYAPSPDAKYKDWQFALTAGLYLVNVLMLYLKISNIYTPDLVFLNPYTLLTASAVAGIWGVWHRRGLSQGILPYGTLHVLWYLAWAAFTMFSIAFLHWSGQDSLLEVAEDGIVYTHLSLGVLYLLYVLRNFGGVIRQNLKAWMVAYEPRRFPFIMVRGAALVIVVAMVFRSNYYSYFQSIAGYHNSIADYHWYAGEDYLAENFYQTGALFDFRNHKSNFALAQLAESKQQPAQAEAYLSKAILKQATPFAYLNLARIQAMDGRLFEAHFTLKKGIRYFPDAAPLQLNLGRSYASLNVVDSALFAYEKAMQHDEMTVAAKGNMLALLIKEGFTNEARQFAADTKEQSVAMEANRLLSGTSSHTFDAQIWNATPTDIQMAYMQNASLCRNFVPDSTFYKRLEALASNDSLGRFLDQVAVVRLRTALAAGDVVGAFEQLGTEENFGSADPIPLRYQLGKYFLQHHIADRAYDLLASSSLQYRPDARLLAFYAGILSSQSVDTTMLRMAAYSSSRENADLATSLLRLLNGDTTYLTPPEIARVRSLRLLRSLQAGTVPYASIGETLPPVLAEAVLEHLLRSGSYQAAYDVYSQKPMQRSDMSAHMKRLIAETLHATGKPLDLDSFPEQGFFSAEVEPDTACARALYQSMLKQFPAYGYGRSMYMRFLLNHGNTDEAYNIGLTGIRIDPLSTPVHQVQAITCIQLGLDTYAFHSLEVLQRTQSITDYTRFRAEFDVQRALVQKSRDIW